MKPHAFFSVNTQFENLGDAVINRELIHLAAKHASIHVDTGRCPEHFINSLDLEGKKTYGSIWSMFFALLVRRFLGKRCYYFLNPGGLGQKLSFKQRAKAILYTIILMLLRFSGVRIIHIGMSYSKLTHIDRLLVWARSKACNKIIPRDSFSARYLDEIGVETYGVSPDLAFTLQKFPSEKKVSGAIFSFRVDGEYQGIQNDVRLMLSNILSELPSKEVLLVAQVERDIPFMKELYAEFCNYENVRFEIFLYDINAALVEYGSYEECYSNRLHVLLMAASQGVVPIAYLPENKGEKVKCLFRDAAINNVILTVSDERKNNFTGLEGVFQKSNVEIINLFSGDIWN